jgi:hypothetical protein
METLLEKIIKVGVLSILIFAGLLVWMVPKTKWSRRIRMNEKIFVITQLIGAFCGMIGIAATAIWPDLIVKTHLMWAILSPYALIWFYYLMVMTIKKTTNIVDEKQDFNMASAGGITMALTVFAMTILFLLYYDGMADGIIWYPYYFFITIVIYSASTLILFKRY